MERITEQMSLPTKIIAAALIFIAPTSVTLACDNEKNSRTQLSEEYHSLLEAEHYEEALQTAQNLVNLTERTCGSTQLELVTPLIDLATTQTTTGDYRTAEANYQRSIALLETQKGFFDQRLVEPLAGLGSIYERTGRYKEAIYALQRAKHTLHRNEGLFNLTQIELIDSLTDIYFKLKQFKDAEREQKYALLANKHQYGEDDPQVVPAMHKLAHWYRLTHKFALARELYEESLEILERTPGSNELTLIGSLQGIGDTYRLSGYLDSDGKEALERALAIMEKKPDPDPLVRAQTLVALGDWHMVAGEKDTALTLYTKALQLLEPKLEYAGHLDRLFKNPVQLYFRLPKSFEGLQAGMKPGYKEGHVEFEFTVTDEGTVEDLKVINSNVFRSIKTAAVYAVQRARYRPRFLNGKPVSTEGIRYRETFIYDESLVSMRQHRFHDPFLIENYPFDWPGCLGCDHTGTMGFQ